MNTAAESRISRARQLASTHPEAAEALTFYASLTTLQESLPSTPDFEALADALPAFLMAIIGIAPPPLAHAARAMLEEGHDQWKHLLHGYWAGQRDVEPTRAFVAEAVLQPIAERTLTCEGEPVVAVLREAAHGSKRSYVCGFCLHERPAQRIGCPACGEARFEKLAVYRADGSPEAGRHAFPARIDACETCGVYLKTIDLTKGAAAVPVVDDIATLTLDVWARERGFRRLRPNLLRL
jgi:FdhE protein